MELEPEEERSLLDRLESAVRWGVALRVPLIGLATLLLMPLLRGSSMLGNLFVVESSGELFLVASVAFAAASLSWICAALTLEYGPRRLQLVPWVRGDLLQRNFSLSVFGPYLVALPLLWGVWSESGLEASFDNIGAIAAGLVVLSTLLWLSNAVRLWLRRISETWTLRPPRPLGAGYVDYETGRFLGGHVSATALFLSLLAVYVVGYFFFHPIHRPWAEVPPLTFALVYLMLLVSLFSGAAFFLDRFRIPLLVAVVVFSWTIYWGKETDHFFAVYVEESAGPRAAPLDSPIEAYLAASQPEPPVVVVCASGGGIWAAAWTAQVLTGLQEELGDSFVRRIRFVSAVSGGSVGAMHFLERYLPSGNPPVEQATCIRALAGRSGLAATVWGIAYPDFLRGTLPFRLLDPIYDRGWVLERTWMRPPAEGCEGAGGVESRLGDWADRTRGGSFPGVVFNATLVETGERLLFSTVRIPGARKAISFLDDPGYRRDLDVVTAARLSATFPYVTPVARPLTVNGDADVDRADHVADGGYFDNFGVFSAIEWVGALAETDSFERLGPIVFLEIRAFPQGQEHLGGCTLRRRGGWYFEAAGPLEAVLAARNSTQTARNDKEIELLRLALGPEKVAPSVIARPRHKPTDGCWCEALDYPLSWHLSPAQRQDVVDQWERIRPELVERLLESLN